MADRLFYIDGSWLTYEQAHSLGYSVLPQRLITFYTINNVSVVIKQDSGDNTYYDSENRQWVADFADLNLYKKVKSNTLFRGESSEEYSCYTSSINDKSYTHIFYNSLIRSTNYTYENYGITAYPCENIIADDSDSPIIWFDASTNKYFDDRDGIHRWVDSLSDIKVTLYDSLLNTEKEIYEDDTNNRFFYDNAFISRDDFYSHDNYGIIRETIFLFKDSLSYEAYYDSYSNEYCIPNITDIWVRKEDLIELDYSFIEGVCDLWLSDTLLRVPWKYLPLTVTLTFANSLHSDLRIVLPEDIEISTGSEVILPSITGIYEDNNGFRWSATRWSIGEFNSSIILNENTVTDIICEKLKATISFANPYYSSLNIPLPKSIIVDNGDVIILPAIEGEYEDENKIKYTPYAWNIGAFNSEYVLKSDVVANLLCEKMKVTLTFSNSIHPELEIQLPSAITRQHNDTVLLPRVRGVRYDNDSIGWIPMKWDLGQFDSAILLDSNKVATLIWEPLAESVAVALCGSMPSDSGASTEAGVSLVLSADGSMRLDEFVLSNKDFTYNCEVFGDTLKIWNSSYTPISVPEFDKNSYTTSEQMLCGTIRTWGIYGNSYTDFSVSGGSFDKDDPVYNKKYFTYNCEVFGDKLKVWNSSFEQVIPVFPQKGSESSAQMIAGTIRSWGNYANRGIDLEISSFADTMNALPVEYDSLYFIENVEVYGSALKIYDKPPYIPIIPIFPDKSDTESEAQMICGTLRISGNKANRGIIIENTFGGF